MLFRRLVLLVQVTKSGRVMTLSCLAAGGNRNGACGYGIGRGHTMEDAQRKAFRKAARSLLVVPRLHEESLLHNVEGKQGQTKVLLHAGISPFILLNDLSMLNLILCGIQ